MLTLFTTTQPWLPVPAGSGRSHAGYRFPVGTIFQCVAADSRSSRHIFQYVEPEGGNGSVRLEEDAVLGLERLNAWCVKQVGEDPIEDPSMEAAAHKVWEDMEQRGWSEEAGCPEPRTTNKLIRERASYLYWRARTAITRGGE
jgi:hypothetical protein